MKVPKNIPAKNVNANIEKIIIDPRNRSAKLVVKMDGQRIEKNINLMDVYNSGNADHKKIIQHFIRAIVAKGLGVSLTDVPNDIFK